MLALICCPLAFDWSENFSPGVQFRARLYRQLTRVDDEAEDSTEPAENDSESDEVTTEEGCYCPQSCCAASALYPHCSTCCHRFCRCDPGSSAEISAEESAGEAEDSGNESAGGAEDSAGDQYGEGCYCPHCSYLFCRCGLKAGSAAAWF